MTRVLTLTCSAADTPATPTVLAISPATGPVAGGTAIAIGGTGLAKVTGVFIGGNAATKVVVVSDQQVTASTPPGDAAGAVEVSVQTADGADYPGANITFTYQ